MTMGSLAEVADPGNQVTTWMRLIHTRSHYRFRRSAIRWSERSYTPTRGYPLLSQDDSW